MMTSTMGLLFRAMRPVAGWAESRESRVDIAQAEAPIVWEANGYRRSVVSFVGDGKLPGAVRRSDPASRTPLQGRWTTRVTIDLIDEVVDALTLRQDVCEYIRTVERGCQLMRADRTKSSCSGA